MANNSDSDESKQGSVGDIFRRYDFKENLGATPPKKGEVLNRRLSRSTKRRVAFEKAAANNGANETLLDYGYASDKATATSSREISAQRRRTRAGTALYPKKSCMKVSSSNKALLEAKKIIDEGRKSSQLNMGSRQQPDGLHTRTVKPPHGNALSRPSAHTMTNHHTTNNHDDSSTSISSSFPMKDNEVWSKRATARRLASLRSQMKLRNRSSRGSHDVYRTIHRQALQSSVPITATISSSGTGGSNFTQEGINGVEGKTATLVASIGPMSTSRPVGSKPSESRPYLLYASILVLLLGSAAVWAFPELTTSLRAIPPPVFEDTSMVQCKHWKSLVKGWSELDASPVRLAGNWYRISDVASGLGIEGDVQDHVTFVASCGGLRVTEQGTDGWLVGIH